MRLTDMQYWQTFAQWVGIDAFETGEGSASVELALATHHRGGGGTAAVNGGVIAYLFDAALGLAAASIWPPDVTRQVTVDLHIQYQRPVIAAERLRAEAEVTNHGRSLVFVTGRIRSEEGRVCASCDGVYRLLRDQTAQIG